MGRNEGKAVQGVHSKTGKQIPDKLVWYVGAGSVHLLNDYATPPLPAGQTHRQQGKARDTGPSRR